MPIELNMLFLLEYPPKHGIVSVQKHQKQKFAQFRIHPLMMEVIGMKIKIE